VIFLDKERRNNGEKLKREKCEIWDKNLEREESGQWEFFFLFHG